MSPDPWFTIEENFFAKTILLDINDISEKHDAQIFYYSDDQVLDTENSYYFQLKKGNNYLQIPEGNFNKFRLDLTDNAEVRIKINCITIYGSRVVPSRFLLSLIGVWGLLSYILYYTLFCEKKTHTPLYFWKRKTNVISVVKYPDAQSKVSHRHKILKEYKSLYIVGDTNEIKHYSETFLRVVDGIVCDKGIEDLPFKKPLYGFETISADNFYFVSSIYLKERTFKVLEDRGLMYGTDFIWAPDWIGQSSIPACYSLSTWEAKEQTYDFSGREGPWDYRYRILLNYLPRKFLRVMDCGAGNMSLRRMLPSCVIYYPVDYKPNYPQTIVCDFNRGEFPAIEVDAVFMCGILEYIENPAWFLKTVCQYSRLVLMTYNTLSPAIQIAQRCLLGWKNHMTSGDIISIFEDNKFRLVKELYADAPETYLIFEKSKAF